MKPRWRPAAVGSAALLALFALAASAAVISSPDRQAPQVPAPPQTPAASAYPLRPPDHVLVQLFRGRTRATGEEINITTIFRERSFTVLGDADVTGGSEEELKARVREVFSLKELASLGSSIVPLGAADGDNGGNGASAVVDDNGHRIEVRVEGQAIGGLSARLLVSESHDGREVVASSVIARSGKTVVLAGPPATLPSGGTEINFVCLTPFR